jgi:transcriptional regulator with XRE-family HTH domain
VSQEELADRADIDRTYVSLLERGLRQPTLDTLFRLAAGLNVAPATLVAKTASSLGR